MNKIIDAVIGYSTNVAFAVFPFVKRNFFLTYAGTIVIWWWMAMTIGYISDAIIDFLFQGFAAL
ncbi:hypothetical protein [Agrobacterium rosae]|uniref:Uncharacterized protein n=1 Tax=Agrobacterium rosae TaxID=1972867 RepID=A0A1R3TIY8_9HYPH|nr:hypothetical protein [Agrobacterium rosae]SCX19779.1 hypothetical protein DSM25559_1893 [Agrobacterium rosae]